MKRLMIISMMFIAGRVHAENAIPQPPASVQSPNDASSKTSDDGISISNVHHIDLDTVDVDGGGNWLNKRIWYQKSQAVFDAIHAAVVTVGDLRVQFSNEVNTIGQKIDTFWETVDYTKGELDDKFQEILAMLDAEQKMLGDLSADDRNLQASIKEQLPVIEQIGKDIKSIHDVDDKIDQTLMQAFKTIDECRDYETKAWDSFKAIGKELDDKKARNLYYQMSNYKQNIEQKNNYLKSTLLPYLHNVLVAKVEMNISKINDAINALKTKSLDLEKIMSKNQENDIVHMRAREKEAADIAVKKAVEDEQVKAKEAADAAAKALAEAKEQSFTNVVNRYYQSTIGKIASYLPTSYSWPVFTYVHHAISSINVYMHNLVQEIMIYFGGKSAAKKIIKEKIEDKVADAQHLVDAIKQKVEDATKPEDTTAKHQDKNVVATVPPTPAASANVSTVSPLVASHPAVTGAAQHEASPAPSATDHNVAIQAIQNDDAHNNDEPQPKEEQVQSSYRVFTAILDLIGSIFTGLYNCILQFFKLVMRLSAFLMSGN